MAAALGPKHVTAHDDTKEFIRGLEMSARKVLTNANRKRMQELKRQQSLARRQGANPEADPPKKFVIEVPPGAEDWGDQLGSKTMEIAPTGMVVGVRATRPSRHRPFDNVEPTATGFPRLGESGTNAADGSDAGRKPGTAGRKLPQITRRAGGLTLSAPASGHEPGDSSGDRTAPGGSRRTVRMGVPAAKIDGRLTESPLFSASMMELTKPQRTANPDNDDPLSGVPGGGEDEEEAGGIANMRVVNASKVIGNARSAGKGQMATRKPRGKGAAETEGQGVTSWSSDDLRVKYRAERQREEAYQAFRLEEQVAEALDKDYGQVVAVPEVDRHPLYVAYYTQLERENTRCLLRASARNKMKRFITDVHTVWLTNLSHHPEFRRMVRGAAANHEHGGDYDANGRGGQTPPATPGTVSSRRGLDGGRDSAAIAASQSQIQSVQPERAFRAAFFYSSGSRDSSSSQPAAERTRQGDEQRRAGQLAAHTAMSYDGVDDTEGGEPPELPPPPLTVPTLAVLVAERRQLAAVSTSGTGNARKSLGGGPRRRSLTGGGAVGVGGGDVGSWLDMSTRVLRVLRFAPPPPAIPVVEAAEGEGGGEGAPLPPPGIGESPLMPPSSSGATWMISSFHPHDGTETRVTIADCAVTKVVGEALSASCPLVMTGPSRVGGTQAGAGSGRAAVSSRTSPSAPQGRGEEGARLLVLRRGVRVPVLGEGGGVVGKVLSVVEVLAAAGRDPGGGGGGEAEDAARTAAMAADNIILEVAAYPAGLFSPPKTAGEHEHHQQQQGKKLRGEGRRRVVLTAESLWKRRRLMRPKAILSEKPPLTLAGWLERESSDVNSPSGTEARDQAGSEEGAAEDGTGHEGPRDEASVGNGSDAGGNGQRGVGRKAQAEALDDLVNMVAFGPIDDRQGRSNDAPLLLRPAQSFGPERTREPAAAVVASETSAGATAQGSSTATRTIQAGIFGTAELLAEESRAEVLLSLVRAGGKGRGRVPAITVEGIPNDLIMPDDSAQNLAQEWEEEADRVEPLSMRVTGRRGHMREVPGTCNIGKMGVTFDYPQAPERTRAVASFFRNASVSSSDSVMVVVTLALDTPRLTPLVTAWERAPFEPEAAPDEDVLDIVPRVMIPPGTVLQEGVVSELGGTVAPDALILTKAERKADYVLPEPLANGGGGAAGAAAAALASQELARRVRHRRDWEETDEKGFRRCAVYHLLEPDGHMQTLGFGVTKRAALPNTAAVCGRSTFHSEQRCTEQLCRQRTAKDYAYVSANDEHRGPSDPGSYSVSCKHERMTALMRTGLEAYNAEMARVAVERERQAKDAALQAKVEIGKAQLANRRAREDAAARSLARKTDAQHLKVSASADRVRRKWELRMQDSHALEVRGSWEKRKDLGGSIFYCCTTEEGLPEPFSWDPPDCWDALDPSALALAEAAAADESSLGEGSGSAIGGGSNQPEGPLTEQLSSLRLLGVDPDRPNDGGGGGGGGTDGTDGHDNDDILTPRPLNEEEKLSQAVDRLAGNEKLLGALAWRLGIPLADVRPDGREPPLARDGAEDEEERDEYREQIELGEHDDASDSDGERGDNRGPPGPLPQDHSDLRRMRISERRRNAQAGAGYGHKQPKRHSIVPRLPLAEEPHDGSAVGLESEVGGLGWRRLARADLGKHFLERVVNPRMQGPRPEAVNTCPKPRPTSTTDPSEATKRTEDWSVPMEAMFVADVVEEHARVLHEAERRMKKEELLDDSSSGPFDAAKFAAHGPQEFTSAERRMMVLAEADPRSKEEVEEEENKAKAVIAAKTSNLSDLEGLLYENVPPDTKDSNGNSLLLLAAQQGSKRIMKFLLRKGATMNVQNMDGNTVLHFCYSQGRQDLAEYLKAKGADDSLLNSEGLTCYEGLQADRVANI